MSRLATPRLALVPVLLLVLAGPGPALAQQPAVPPPNLDPSVVVIPPSAPSVPIPDPPTDPADVADADPEDGDGIDPGLLPEPQPPLVTTATVPGRTARMRTDGKAAIPRGAPKRIRSVIAAANLIVGKPYKWGGGHAELVDRGYDCSGAVSFALVRAGLLSAPQVSGTLAHWAVTGSGRWMTIYANKGHVYLEVAGLRLDTSGMGDDEGGDGVRWRPVIGGRPRFARRHVLGL